VVSRTAQDFREIRRDPEGVDKNRAAGLHFSPSRPYKARTCPGVKGTLPNRFGPSRDNNALPITKYGRIGPRMALSAKLLLLSLGSAWKWATRCRFSIVRVSIHELAIFNRWR
jgi:hypothetical protein